MWDLESGQSVRTPLQGHSSYVLGVAITPDGRRAVSASEDKTLRVWDLESRKELALLTADGPTASCAISLDTLRLNHTTVRFMLTTMATPYELYLFCGIL